MAKPRGTVRATRTTPHGATTGHAQRSEPGPEHWRYLEALTDLLDSDEDFTTRALARRLQMAPEALLQFQHERPDVTQWASEQLEAEGRAMVGPLLRRVAELASAGSAEHADLLLRFAARELVGAVERRPGKPGPSIGPLVVNIVVPDTRAERAHR